MRFVAARISGATMRLRHVFPVPAPLVTKDVRGVAYADQEMARLEVEGRDYLNPAKAPLECVTVECGVRFGEPAAQTLREVEAFGADLIAVTTAGRSAIGRVALGSLAGQVFRKAGGAVARFHSGSHGGH